MHKNRTDMPYAVLPKLEGTNGQTLLNGVRIVDLTTSIAGPYATQLLADLGATVYKIEKHIVGDDARHWGPPFIHGESPWFLSVNRNKHSVALNLGCPEGLDVLYKLIEQCDVLVVNLVESAQRRLGVDYACLSSKFPKLIHASLTGFGLKGARSHLPSYDLIAEGYSGVMDLTGEAENAPQKVGTPAADLLAGQDVALAVLAAYIDRERTGKGSQLDVSMQTSMTRFMAPRLASYLSSNELPHRSGGKDSVIAIYQVFDTADKQISLGLGNDNIWRRFWVALGQPAMGKNLRYASNAERRKHRDEIVAKIAQVLRTRLQREWLETFEQHRVPAGPINTLQEVARDEELLKLHFLYQVDTCVGTVPQVGLGITINGNASVHRKAPPTLGEDTEVILNKLLNLSQEDIIKLRQSGAIG
ncbi:crotonobetainyl-CoA:carnitine CoA-transferase CaiB-like acyl-CoA transferase [Advenella incenata]|uniref:Crotonobetainyl-CoA:carnitine CoA-transferase CaiB-like acyl-CoA transferase n=1 Tax=Advenella incenata TaxID=267800 RepID=A0A4Q7VF24_9BURK|nr:CoA transferase [Advenella incenata]RZT94834.1 crotonobetainyl-CoA:carnitine CoA-transferase CaiB-like acyl-CoA transferase [Advenella incenata]